MQMLSEADLAYMRSTQEEFLPSEAHIDRLTPVKDARGGYDETQARLLTDERCRVSRATQQDLTDFGDMWKTEPRWVVSIRSDAGVAVDDLVILANSKTLRVVGVMNGDEDWRTVQRLAAVDA